MAITHYPEVKKGLGDKVHFDGGNAFVKFNAGRFISSYPHAIAEMTPAEYKLYSEELGDVFNPDLIQIHYPGGWRYFLVGDSALRDGEIQPLVGRLKYERGYYGVMFASAIGRMFFKNSVSLTELEVYASYPPSDKVYTADLKDCISGHWKMIVGGTGTSGIHFEFDVNKVSAYAEPWGGFRNEALQWSNGRRSYVPALMGKRVAVLDIGGGTHSTYWVDQSGVPLERRAQSFDMGINDVMETFRTQLQDDKELRPLWRKVRSITPEMLREGVDTNFINMGNIRFEEERLNEKWFYKTDDGQLTGHLKVEKFAASASKRILNSIANVWSTVLAGGSDTDTLVLSGGGSAILGNRIKEGLRIVDLRYSGGDVDKIMFATVLGARKSNVMSVEI